MLPQKLHLTDSVKVTFLRMGLVSAGALLFHLAFMIVSTAPLSKSPADIIILIITGISGLFLLVSAGVRRPPDFFRWLILFACIGELGVRSIIWAQTYLLASDTALYTDMAGELLRHGENPYTWDFAGVFDLYRISQIFITPKLDGASVSNFPYPALPFLLVIPFQALNLPGTFSVSVVVHIAMLILIFLASPKSIQPLILIPIVAGIDLISPTLFGSLDIIWATLLIGMVVAWRKPALRAVLFGLAAAVKQSPWLVIPFLIIRIWRDKASDSPIRSVGRFLIISGATFLIINVPFIVSSPKAWLQGVTEPLRDDLVFVSFGGLSSLSQFGLAYLPKSYYLIATLSVLGLLLFCYWRHHNVLRNAFWIMPGIFMWFSYRSLVSYWTSWVFPILATLVTRTSPIEEPRNKPAWRPTLAIVTFVLGSLFIIAIALSFRSAPIEVHPLFPLSTTYGQISRMSVQVINNSRRTLTPRFAVQNRYAGRNPLPWHIDQGPHSLAPRQSATFHISTAKFDSGFFAHDVAQIVVTDAGGDYSLRGIATIGPDRSFLWPDAIPNPAYLFWEGAPIFWQLATAPPASGAVSFENKNSRGALRLALDANDEGLNRVALQTQITFPLNPFGIWVYSDPPADDPSRVAYGLEIDDGQHQLWLLFCSQDCAAQERDWPLEEGQYIINRIVPSRTWIFQEIDVPAAYAEAGWPLPDLKPVVYRGLDVDLRLVNLGLLLATNGPRDHLQAYFGPIEQDSYQVEPQILMAETFDDPASYYIRIAESYVRGRNYSLALEAYQRALEFSPDDSDILERIESLAACRK